MAIAETVLLAITATSELLVHNAIKVP